MEWYDELLRFADTPIVRLNRAVAVGEADGAPAGLAALAEVDDDVPRRDAVAAYLHEKNGDLELAARLYADAAATRPTSPSATTRRARPRASTRCCGTTADPVAGGRRARVGLRVLVVGEVVTPLGVTAGEREVVMNVVAVAPCQCHSSGGVTITSPGRMRTSGPPRACTQPSPSVTHSVCPAEWRCQAVCAHGVKCTDPRVTAAPSCAAPMGSMYTSPVNHSAGPFQVGAFGCTSTTTASLRMRRPPPADIVADAGPECSGDTGTGGDEREEPLLDRDAGDVREHHR